MEDRLIVLRTPTQPEYLPGPSEQAALEETRAQAVQTLCVALSFMAASDAARGEVLQAIERLTKTICPEPKP